MSNLKKIIITLPDSLLKQADQIAEEQKNNRSELIREALILYLAEQKKKRIRTELIRGYEEMKELNLRLAEEGMGESLENQKVYEEKWI